MMGQWVTHVTGMFCVSKLLNWSLFIMGRPKDYSHLNNLAVLCSFPLNIWQSNGLK